jgi:hypothetical protein
MEILGRKTVEAGGLWLALVVSAGSVLAAELPHYDATGYWRLRFEAPRLEAGECALEDEEGYEAVAKVTQTGDRFGIAVGEEAVEQGTVDGATYAHGSRQSGQDPSGVRFTVAARSVFRLGSPSTAKGETTLDLSYADGMHCIFRAGFRGEKLPEGPTPATPESPEPEKPTSP